MVRVAREGLLGLVVALVVLGASPALAATYYVAQSSPGADDSNPGTEALPWLTIGRAASTLQAGDTVVIGSGTYRETVAPPRGGTSDAHRISYVGSPGQSVVVSQADLATGWTLEGADWWIPWTTSLPVDTSVFPHVDPATQFAHRREQVIANGVLLLHVPDRADLSAGGRFWVEGPPEAPSRIFVRLTGGADPNTQTMEVGRRDAGWAPAPSASYLTLRNVTIRYGTAQAQTGSLSISEGSHHLYEDVTVEWSNARGVDFHGTNHVFRRVHANDNGQMGWGGGAAPGLLEDCQAIRNNWKSYDANWEAGGTKFAFSVDLTVRRMLAADNNGPGIWFGIDNAGGLVEQSVVTNNVAVGIFLELNSNGFVVRNNVVHGTRFKTWMGVGILVTSSSDNVIVHNTLYANDDYGLSAGWYDGRARTINNRFVNNIVSHEGAAARIIGWFGQDDARSNTFDGNLYWSATALGIAWMWDVYLGGGHQGFMQTDSLAQWHAVTGSDGLSRVDDPQLENPSTAGGWHIRATSPAIGMGVTPPVPVELDFDGQPRPSTGADSGADQYVALP